MIFLRFFPFFHDYVAIFFPWNVWYVWKRHGIGTDCRGLRATLCAFVPLPWKPSLSTLPFHPIVYPFLQSHTSKFKSWQIITVGRPSFRYIPNYVEPLMGLFNLLRQPGNGLLGNLPWDPCILETLLEGQH